jgi:drug/metabolite transporter (DMT)-like permease
LNSKTRTLRYALFILGIALCLTGAVLMVHGSVFGDRTTGIATITGIVGIGLISTFTTKSTLKNTTKSPEKIITSAKRWQP